MTWFRPVSKPKPEKVGLKGPIVHRSPVVKSLFNFCKMVGPSVDQYGELASVWYSWLWSWQVVVYVFFIIAAGNSISSQLDSSCQCSRNGTARQAVRPIHHSTNHTCRGTVPQLSYAWSRVGPALHDNGSHVASSLCMCPYLIAWRIRRQLTAVVHRIPIDTLRSQELSRTSITIHMFCKLVSVCHILQVCLFSKTRWDSLVRVFYI